ncbi:MAG: RluA family pseudouridine synthase [Peptococcaceae bacterium]|jgi:23S rRNA pseudouridine1911/1915/1917 synthase|nr:RluA family pseudouridine synthase [Peptococcaceae bacterium]MDH7524306.1 RluA family pseudouridine synthase [Peptococcaceae bacterium]
MERLVFSVAQENKGMRLDVFLKEKMGNLSRTQVQRLIAENKVIVNGKPEKANYRINLKDEIRCEIQAPQPLLAVPEPIALDIVYEDPDLIVVNKPQGMVVHPASGRFSGTLVNALLYHCRDLSGINGVLRPGIVHRLDKDTSGLLLVAKNDEAHHNLARQLKEHTVKRIYIALVHGKIAEPGGIIEAPIGRDLKDRKKMAVVLKNSKAACTEYIVLERLEGYTLVECRLKTGRTHQIRVHMAYIHHPVAGDPKYGPKKTLPGLTGQALHAGTIGFFHPRTEEWLEFSCPPPPGLVKVLEKLGSKYLFVKERG